MIEMNSILKIMGDKATTCDMNEFVRQLNSTLNAIVVTNGEIIPLEAQLDNLFHNMKNNIITMEDYAQQVTPVVNSLVVLCDRLKTALELLLELHENH